MSAQAPIAIVTGASRGAGRGIAIALGSHGCTVYVTGRYGAVAYEMAGLISWLMLFVGITLLFTARYPRGIFDFVLGMDRWVLRVGAYTSLMTDSYPPFRLDQGGADPAQPPAEPGSTAQVAP